MAVEPAIITKDARMAPRVGQEPAIREAQAHSPRFERRSNMRVVAQPRRPRDPPAGSVDLRSLHYTSEATEEWGRGTRVQDVITTVNAAIDETVECFIEVIGDTRWILNSGAKRNAVKRSGFERPFQARQVRLGMAS